MEKVVLLLVPTRLKTRGLKAHPDRENAIKETQKLLTKMKLEDYEGSAEYSQ